MSKKILWSLLFLCVFAIMHSCKPKDSIVKYDSNVQLRFSEDTVQFDTILTSVSSITKRFWVYNDSKNAIEITSIGLGSLDNSDYTLYVDGKQTETVTNKVLYGQDSLLVLVEVEIDPMDQSKPFLSKDSVVFVTNDNSQNVKLLAYGQDAEYLQGDFDACDVTLQNDKPYIIIDSLYVPESCSLTIEKGCKFYFNKGAKLIIDGSLLVKGEKDSIVRFTSDSYFSDQIIPEFGYWEGIFFGENSEGNRMSWFQVYNSRTAISYEGSSLVDSVFDIEIDHAIVLNSFDDGLQFKSVDALVTNSLIAGSIDQNVDINDGGNYVFYHSTISNDATTDFNSDSSVVIQNGDGLTNVRFENSIIWGDQREEIKIENGVNFVFSNNLLNTNIADLKSGNTIDEDPNFQSVVNFDYSLDSTSSAIDVGVILLPTETDLSGELRDDKPDLGAYEFRSMNQ